MRDAWVQDYLTQKVIETLKTNGFDYLKVDYNDNIGVGVDSKEGLGAGLEASIKGTRAFFKKIKAELPGIKIENCSSGGHRLTPAFIDITDYSSFSDAHETTSIPIIAANELCVLPAAKNLIWVVLHPEESNDQLIYRLLGGFLGRICLSGKISGLSDHQWQLIDQGLEFYQHNAYLIKNGIPLRLGPEVLSYRQPTGWQLTGFSDNSDISQATDLFLVAHVFKNSRIDAQLLPGLRGEWQVSDQFGNSQITLTSDGGKLHLSAPKASFIANAWHLRRVK